jgi:ABC-2 type transport system permease protein
VRRLSYLNTLIKKELWLFISNKKNLALVSIIPAFVLFFTVVVPMLTGPRTYTPETYALALKYIKESSYEFGLTQNDVDKLGENAITFVTIFQLPPVLGIFAALAVFQTITASFMAEKSSGTMEIMLASPVEIEEIVISKALVGVLMGIITWMMLFLGMTLSLEYLSIKYIGKIWIPCMNYIWSMVILPISLLLLGLALSLFAGIRGSEFLAGLFIFIITGAPIGIIMAVAIFQLPAQLFFLLLELLGGLSFLLSILIIAMSYKMIDRLSFIRNY